MANDSWFHDGDQILSEIRRSQAGGFFVQIPGYTQIAELARGGQATVYQAIQIGTQRKVAIKVMFWEIAHQAQLQSRFSREIELVGSLDHPSIVRIYDGGVLSNGQPFTVMEFVEGEHLDKYLDLAMLSTRSTVELFARICDAVGYAHRRGVMHRDLKPSNIVVTEDGTPHVLDFGIARAIGDSNSSTFTGQFVGTLAYASPEQIESSPNAIDSRTDVYSLGVMMYRLISGSPPYQVDGPIGETVNAIKTVEPVAPSRISPRSDSELDAIILRSLEKHPDRRYQSVDALSTDLRRYLSGEALEAKRDQTWYQLSKIIRRHRMKFVGAMAALLTLISFSIFVTSLWRRVSAEEQKTSEIKVFWEDTLGSVSPTKIGKPVTFGEVLDEAVHWVALTTENRPEIEASLRTTIGNGYRNIGRFDQAESQLQKSLAIRQKLHGPGHPDVFQSLNSIALLRKSEGKIEQAQHLFSETLAARQKSLGTNHPDVAMSLQNLGRLEMESGNLESAKSHFQRALEIRKRHFTSDDLSIATVYFNQGDLAAAKNDWSAAEKMHNKALMIRRAGLPDTHPDVGRSLIALSRIYQQSARLEQAKTVASEVLRIRKQVMPEEHQLVQEVKDLLVQLNNE